MKRNSLLSLFVPDFPLCAACVTGLDIRMEKVMAKGVPVWVAEGYSKPLIDWLYRYKGLGDYEMKDVFFRPLAPWIWSKALGRRIVVAPSTEANRKKRGFDHMAAMVQAIGLKPIPVLAKSPGKDQKDLHRSDRVKVKSRLTVIDPSAILGKRILLIDDVMTTGATLLSSRELLLEAGALSVKCLVLTRKEENAESLAG